MTLPRSRLISLDATPYYRCMARCVRRAFLCGYDEVSGKNFEHRRQWVVDRLAQLGDIFCIDISAYAVMSNHYHVVLRADREMASTLTDDQVIERWTQLFQGPLLVQRKMSGVEQNPAEQLAVGLVIDTWRKRLSDISWFMRCLNEHLARLANNEDGCKGRFWEGRFKSQALLDDAALLACMAYVDLNPVRAGLADKPETSDFTSIQQRVLAVAKAHEDNCPVESHQPTSLLPFSETMGNNGDKNTLPYGLYNYLELVDWTGRAVRADKRGSIPSTMPPILQRLGQNRDEWLAMLYQYQKPQRNAFGNKQALQAFAAQLERCWIKGVASLTK